jgi:hypothetical protein
MSTCLFSFLQPNLFLRQLKRGEKNGQAFLVLIHICTVWTVDFEMPVCKLYFLFISADCCPRKRKKEKKVLLPTDDSKSAAHTVLYQFSVPWLKQEVCTPAQTLSSLP